jgi:hypothetical protein
MSLKKEMNSTKELIQNIKDDDASPKVSDRKN